MKKFFVLSLVILGLGMSSFASDFLFRVQVGSYARGTAPTAIRKVPNFKKYVLPESVQCIFSGGYFLAYKGAISQLQKVKDLGYEKAVVRIFRNEKLLTYKSANKVFAEKEMDWLTDESVKNPNKQVWSLSKQITLKNRMLLYNEFRFPDRYEDNTEEIDDSIKEPKKRKKLKFGFIEDMKKKKLEKKQAKEEAEKAEQKQKEEATEVEEEEIVITEEMKQELETAMNEEIVEEILGANDVGLDEENTESLVVGEIVFKVYLGSNKKGSKPLKNIDVLPEIVYTYEKKDLQMYTVGYFENSSKANSAIDSYRAQGFPHAKIVGLYKGIIVSERVALAIEVANQK